MNNEETKPAAMDPVTSVLFDLGYRITTARDNLITAEQLHNKVGEINQERKLTRADCNQLESLLIATKEFFDVVNTDLLDELFQSIQEENEPETELKEA